MNSLWGSYDLEVGQAGRWTIGGASLWLGRREQLVLLGTAPAVDHSLSSVSVELPLPEAEPPEGLALRRFATGPGAMRIRIEPEHADRPVVVRAHVPLVVPPGVTALAYVSAPLWVGVSIGETRVDVPLLRPSDTWFGGPTADDGLAYASRTSLRVDVDEVPERVHRVVVTVRITNAGDDMLEVNRLRLPVGRLHLFEAEGGGLWSNTVEFLREEGGESARVRIAEGPPAHRPTAREVAQPRLTDEFNPVQRAFDALLR